MRNTHTTALARQLFFLVAGPLLCLLLKDLPPLPGMNPNGMLCLGACAWLLIWWVSEVLPLPVTSLVAVPLFGLMGLITPDKAFALIGHPAMMLIFGATIIVGVWKESRLIERYAYWCFNLPFVNGKPVRMVLVFTLASGIMSAIAPNIPLTILFVGIAVAIAKSCQLSAQHNLMRSLCTLSAIAPALGGVGTPLGGAPNIIAIAVIAAVLGHDVTFGQWAALGMPLVLLTLLACFAITSCLFPLRGTSQKDLASLGNVKDKLRDLGPISWHEHAAIAVMVIALILWCCGPQLLTFLGFPAVGAMMTTPVVALFMGVATFLLPIRREEHSGKLVFAMNWEQAVRNIGWGIIVLQIGAIAFGQVLLEGGVDKWMALGIKTLVGDVQGVWVWFALVLLTGFLSQIILSLAVIPLMLPITASLALAYGFDPLLACLSVSFVSNLTTMFPFSSVAVAAVIGGGEGYARAPDFVLTGLLTTVVVTAVTFVFCYLLGPVLL